jgi:CheY-like chemotaxis protein
VLEVSDTGTGIDEETRQHIFEPFFTTKDRDKGTGLGLSTVYGIAKQSGGDIDCTSRPGRGTCFRLYLPRTLTPAAPPKPAPSPAPSLDDGSGTILVVEDDSVVRGLLCLLLRPKGYTVLEAADAAAAIELFDRFGATIDLLISDVVMPGMRGPELARRLVARNPRLKALLISGFTDGESVAPEAVAAGSMFLHKPFGNEELLAKVRRLLDDDRRPAAVR